MISPRIMIQFLRRKSLIRVFIWLMGVGILILLDNLATIYLASLVGAYAAVALVGLMTWVNLMIAFSTMDRHIQIIRKNARHGVFSKIEFMHVSGLTLSALLIIIPGLLTDTFAALIFLQPCRLGVGSLIYQKFHLEFEQLHQHLSTEE